MTNTRMRTEKVSRKVEVDGELIRCKLEATDIMGKKEFKEWYNGRVQERQGLKDQLKSVKEQLKNIEEYENDEKIKTIAKSIESDQELAQKVFALMQKKMLADQVQIWEKSLELMDTELEDLSATYQSLKAEETKEVIDGNKDDIVVEKQEVKDDKAK